MWWNEIAYAEGMGGVLGVKILQAVDDNIYQEKDIAKRSMQILKEIPKEQIPDFKKLLSEINKLADYCNAWADDSRYMETDDDNKRTAINLESIPYSQYKNLYGELGEIWLDGYHRAIDDIMKRIDAVKILACIINLSKITKQ